jgi:predicted ABC-type ATPase
MRFAILSASEFGGISLVRKDSAASKKAWLTRPRKSFSLSSHNAANDDPSVTARKVLSAFTAEDRQEVAKALIRSSTVPSSKADNTIKDGPNKGQYTKERQVLHNKIIAKFLSPENIAAATPAEGEAPTYVVLGGRGGSGKSAFTDPTSSIKEFDSSKFLKLDTDAIKGMLIPPYAGWNAGSVHEESSDIFEAITSVATGARLNLLHDSTLKTNGVESTIKNLKSKGYRVEGHYMYVPRQVSAVRAVKRYLGKGPGQRGRLVPVDVILANINNEKNFDSFKPYFDKWSSYDNMVPKGTAPKLLGRGP